MWYAFYISPFATSPAVPHDWIFSSLVSTSHVDAKGMKVSRGGESIGQI